MAASEPTVLLSEGSNTLVLLVST